METPRLVASALLVVTFLSSACAPPGHGGDPARPDGGSGGGGNGGGVVARPLLDVGLARVAAFDDRGALVVVGLDGSPHARRELGEGVPTDLVADPAQHRLLVVLEREEDHLRIVAVPWDGEQLGAPTELADGPGRGRIAAVHQGVMIAADADGPRVRLLREDGQPTRGRHLAPPRTWWTDDADGLVHGLELAPGGEATRFTLGVDAEGSAAITGRHLLGVAPAEARLVVVSPGDERLVALDAATGIVAWAPVPTAGPIELTAGGAVADAVVRLEGAAPWPLAADTTFPSCGGDSARGVAIATAEPPAVTVASWSGEHRVRIPLDAAPPSGSPYGRRDLAVVDGALLVATHGGVLALRAVGGSLAVRVDDAFDGETLRGPLLCLPR